jgi:hypothetical protein
LYFTFLNLSAEQIGNREGLRLCHARGRWERGSARGQMQEFAAGKFQGTLLFSRHVSAEYRATRSLSPGLFVNCSPAVGTNAAIAMKRASARPPGSSEMMKATAVPVRV